MIKKIIINSKTIPVPVPLRTLAELTDWIQGSLVKPGCSITKLVVDGNELAEERWFDRKMILSDSIRVEFRIESPRELLLQVLEARRRVIGQSVVVGHQG